MQFNTLRNITKQLYKGYSLIMGLNTVRQITKQNKILFPGYVT